ncbi:MAG: SAM-dependent chlorinase/fluorinase [Lactimicrobium massiliense]|nr:SAM-dependent chlorinase/fluorinase [Lactimicrobium massiliense]MDD6560336.1 SAM-dependent chlorinase/fluorinase [Lactimicrobium massiliense]
MKPSIVLQTDFSLSWSAVSEMKGVIRMVDHDVEIVDSCHEIRQFDPFEASLALETIEPYWPKGTIFVSVVDPGVGTDRRACAVLLNDGSIVITPDNGSLTHLKYSVGIKEVRQIDESINRYHGPHEAAVFDGRDLFGYCAAKLSAGIITYEQIGPAYPVSEVVECEEYHLKPELKDNVLSCFVMTGLPHFGGIQFNVDNAMWRRLEIPTGTLIHVVISHSGHCVFDQNVVYARSFGYVKQGEPVLYCGSSGYLSLDCNKDNFMAKYGVSFGKDWQIQLRLS